MRGHQGRGLATALGHLHAAAIFSRTIFNPPSEKCPVNGSGGSGREMDGDFAFIGERLQQTHDVALKSNAGTKRRRACRNLHRLTAIDAVSYGVILASARKRLIL